ncbi:MAG: iron-sulfur protein, partial [Actinobacteria bacterium]
MTTTEAPPSEERAAPRRLPRPSAVIGALGVLSVIATLALWWLGSLPDEVEFETGRPVFINIPDVVVALFYVAVTTFIGVTSYLFAVRAKSWQRGAAESRSGLLERRLHRLREGLTMRTLLRDRQAGLMHSMIYYGFLVLFLGTVTLEIDHLLPGNLKFLHGPVYLGYSMVLDLFALVFLGGLAWAAFRRYVQRPLRLRTKTKPEDGWILLTLALIGITGLVIEAARISLVGRPDFERWSFVGFPLSGLVPESIASGFHLTMWIVHAAAFMAFLVVLPTTKLRHMLTSPANMALSVRARPKGAMREMPNLLEATDVETVGASVPAEFTWKSLFDTEACTVCGRCTSVCPANTTGKPLDPREIVLKLGEVATQTAADPVSSPVSM